MKDLGNRIRQSALLRVVAIVALPSLLAAVAWVKLRPAASVDEAVATLAVPLVVMYLMIRLLDLAASRAESPAEPPVESADVRTQSSERMSPFLLVFVLAFVAGMWFFLVASISALAYLVIDLKWGLATAIVVMKLLGFVIASSAVLICLRQLFRVWVLKLSTMMRSLFHWQSPIHGH